jgi:hypothetical protein
MSHRRPARSPFFKLLRFFPNVPFSPRSHVTFSGHIFLDCGSASHSLRFLDLDSFQKHGPGTVAQWDFVVLVF